MASANVIRPFEGIRYVLIPTNHGSIGTRLVVLNLGSFGFSGGVTKGLRKMVKTHKTEMSS